MTVPPETTTFWYRTTPVPMRARGRACMKAPALDCVRSEHMKKLSVMIVLAGMLLAGEAGAQTYNVWGAGAASCGTWVTDRRGEALVADIDFAWVQGYITGLNAANNGQVGAQFGEADAAEVWLDNYCTAHPLDHLIDATDQLYTSARSQNK